MCQRGPRRVFAFLAFFLVCAALKASPLVQLQLEAPAECPSKDSIERTLARLVKRPPATPLQVSARLAPDGERWVLVASLEGGQRVVGGDSCVAAAEALVVIMALAIDPASQVNASALQDFEHANAVHAQPSQPPPATVAPVAPMQSTAPNSGGSDWRMVDAQAKTGVSAPPWQKRKPDRLGISWLWLGEWGALPKASLGTALFLRYGSRLRWGELSVSGLYPRIEYEGGSSIRGARLGMLASQLAGCAAPGYEWPVAGCLGAEFGDLIGRGTNTDRDETHHTLWAALTAAVVYRGRLRRDWGLELRLAAAVPAARPDFGVNGYGWLFTPGPVSIRGFVGVSWR